MSREISFRAWTGKTMMYQDQQYLGSFLRRVVLQIMLEHGSDAPKEHESYLPKGTTIDDYLMQYTGCKDILSNKKIYEGDIVRWEAFPPGTIYTKLVRWDNDQSMFLPNGMKDGVVIIGNMYENPDLLTH